MTANTVELQTEVAVKTQEYQQPEYEKLVDEFLAADDKYKLLEEYFMNGTILKELLDGDYSTETIIGQYKLLIEEMKAILEERNTKLTAAKNALRAAVILSEQQRRGPEGHATTINYKGFHVSSVTRRTLAPNKLLEGAARKGCLQDLLMLQGMDKTGAVVHMVEPVYTVNYEGVTTWLKQRGLGDVLEESYEEKESTPSVKGPKKLAFFGEKKDE